MRRSKRSARSSFFGQQFKLGFRRPVDTQTTAHRGNQSQRAILRNLHGSQCTKTLVAFGGRSWAAASYLLLIACPVLLA
jgi:hypothetical protein